MGIKIILKKLKFKNTFVKLVLSYILITTLIIFVLSMLLYKLFLGTSLDVIEADSKARLSQNINHLSLIRSRVVSLGQQLLKDAEVMQAIYGKAEIDPFVQAALYRKMNNIIDSDSLIHSIFLYNAKSKQMNHTFGEESKAAFTSRMLHLLKDYNAYDRLQFLPSKISFKRANGYIAENNVITVIFSERAYYNEKSNQDVSELPMTSAILVNFNADSIQESIASTSQEQKSESIIIDKKGNVVFDSVKENFASNIAKQEYIKAILNSKKQEDIITKNINSDKSLVVYKNVEVPEWIFINVYTYKNLFSKIDNLGRVIILVCICILIVSLFVAIITTRRIFTPFRRLLNKVGEGLSPNNHGISNLEDSLSDVQYLTQTFSQIKHRMLELESSVNESIPTLKKALLKKVVQGKYNEKHESTKRFDELFKELTNGRASFLVLVVSIDEYLELKEKDDSDFDSIMFLSIESLVHKMLSKYFYCESMDYENNYLHFLIKIEEDCFISSQNRSILTKIHEDLQQSLNLKISFSVGMPVRFVEDIYLSYSNALDLIKYRLVHGYGSFFCYDMDELVSKESVVSIIREKEKLLNSIKMCDIKRVEIEISSIIEEISQCQYDYIMLTLNQLILDIMESVKSFFENDSDKLNYNNIYSNMNRIGTLNEMKEFLILYCAAAIDKIEKKRMNRKNDMFQDIIAYIADHYHEYDIKTDYLANMANLTPGYFGKLFAESIGKTVNEYILELRLSKSKELLESTDLSINEISSRIGFGNSTYFTSLFKKSFDVTPHHYRTNHRMGM